MTTFIEAIIKRVEREDPAEDRCLAALIDPDDRRQRALRDVDL